MTRFNNEEERAAWALAESLIETGRAMMRKAETALETFTTGLELTRQHCLRRGIGATDAEIRWSETANARKALAENSFHVSQAMMYYGAAAANYSRALYLRRTGETGAAPTGAAVGAAFVASKPAGRTGDGQRAARGVGVPDQRPG